MSLCSHVCGFYTSYGSRVIKRDSLLVAIHQRAQEGMGTLPTRSMLWTRLVESKRNQKFQT
jgi:hypothetical protein